MRGHAAARIVAQPWAFVVGTLRAFRANQGLLLPGNLRSLGEERIGWLGHSWSRRGPSGRGAALQRASIDVWPFPLCASGFDQRCGGSPDLASMNSDLPLDRRDGDIHADGAIDRALGLGRSIIGPSADHARTA